jgi:hypothetical protein
MQVFTPSVIGGPGRPTNPGQIFLPPVQKILPPIPNSTNNTDDHMTYLRFISRYNDSITFFRFGVIIPEDEPRKVMGSLYLKMNLK